MVKEGDLLWEPGEIFKRDSNVMAFMHWLREPGLRIVDDAARRRSEGAL